VLQELLHEELHDELHDEPHEVWQLFWHRPAKAPVTDLIAGMAFSTACEIFPITSETLLASQPVMKIEQARSIMIEIFLSCFIKNLIKMNFNRSSSLLRMAVDQSNKNIRYWFH